MNTTIREIDPATRAAQIVKHLADCVILTHDNKILMQFRPEGYGRFGGCLNIFGGHVEDGEDVITALIRELHEELGAIVRPEDVRFIATVTEGMTDHSEAVHIHFWHDRAGTITGCYECEARHYDTLDDALAHPKIMDYARWALLQARERGFLSGILPPQR